ncbi:hypothetical protein L9F63_014521, partial [Diploptera punctata]
YFRNLLYIVFSESVFKNRLSVYISGRMYNDFNTQKEHLQMIKKVGNILFGACLYMHTVQVTRVNRAYKNFKLV